MGAWTNLGDYMSFGDLDPTKNEYRDPNQANFQLGGYADRRDALNNQGNQFLNRNAPQAANVDNGYQTAALDMLRRRANGEDSLVGEQGRQAMSGMEAQQRAAAAGAGPTGQAMGQRLMMQNLSRGGGQIDANTRMGQIAERQQALGGLGALATQQRGQDINQNQYNANLQQQGQALNQQGYLGAQGLGLQNAQAEQQGNMGYEGARTDRFNQISGVPTTGERALSATVGGIEAGAKGAYALSDERAKTNIQRILPGELAKSAPGESGPMARPEELSRERKTVRPEELSRSRSDSQNLRRDELTRERPPVQTAYTGEALGAPKLPSDENLKKGIAPLDKLAEKLTPYKYEYKDQRFGAGPRVGVMAQNVEKGGPLGKAMVSEMDGAKVIDMPKAVGTNMALSGHLAARLDELESKLASLGKKRK